jgi:hypothetical protein
MFLLSVFKKKFRSEICALLVYVFPKRRSTITTQRCVIFQKTRDLSNIAAESWNQNSTPLLSFSITFTLGTGGSSVRPLSYGFFSVILLLENGNENKSHFYQPCTHPFFRERVIKEWNNLKLTLISCFRLDVDVICGLLGDYTASWGN